jgi:hypothetical protein
LTDLKYISTTELFNELASRSDMAILIIGRVLDDEDNMETQFSYKGQPLNVIGLLEVAKQEALDNFNGEDIHDPPEFSG